MNMKLISFCWFGWAKDETSEDLRADHLGKTKDALDVLDFYF